MKNKSMRVMVASEYPEVRYFLREAVEREQGAVVVGQAENATRALALARNLRPDVALIDSYLPYNTGLDAIPLSRMGGLDAAQAATAEVPDMCVVLLNTETAMAEPAGAGHAPPFSREVGGVSTPFTLQDLCGHGSKPDSLVFADVSPQTKGTLRSRVAGLSDKAIVFGILGVLAGLLFILTLILAIPGGFLAIAGAAVVLLGLMAKAVSRFWPAPPAGRGTPKPR